VRTHGEDAATTPKVLVTSTVAVLGDTTCPGLIPESVRKLDPLSVDDGDGSADEIEVFSRVKGGGGLALNGKETDVVGKNEKLGDAFRCVRVALGG
jgi:hypothetical protein